MNWNILGKELNPEIYGLYRIDQILCEYDGPKTFTLKDIDDDLYLAHYCDDDGSITRFLLVPFSTDLLTRLTTGTISLRQSLEQPRLWLVDSTGDWKPQRVWRCSLVDVPENCLPDKSVMLWPSLEPLLSLRTVGETIGEGTTPASVITDVIEGAKKAVKMLVEHVRELGQLAGRPADARRKWYDLPTQNVRFASFEISFRMPADDPQTAMSYVQDTETKEEIYGQVGRLLQRGFQWLDANGTLNENVWVDQKEKKVVLEAMESLIPSSVGPVKTLEIRGQLVAALHNRTGRPIRLDKNSKRYIKAALTQTLSTIELIVREKGFIRELDKDRYTFELRKSPDDIRSSIKFSFDDDLADEVNESTYSDQYVEIVGVTTSEQRPVHARIINPLPELPEKEDSK